MQITIYIAQITMNSRPFRKSENITNFEQFAGLFYQAVSFYFQSGYLNCKILFNWPFCYGYNIQKTLKIGQKYWNNILRSHYIYVYLPHFWYKMAQSVYWKLEHLYVSKAACITNSLFWGQESQYHHQLFRQFQTPIDQTKASTFSRKFSYSSTS